MRLYSCNRLYTKMITSVVLVSTILSGCSSNTGAQDEPLVTAEVEPVATATVEPLETAEIAEDNGIHDIEKNQKYYLNYYKIGDNERARRMERLDIKYPDSVHWSIYIKTIIVEDHGTYKVIPALEIWDLNKQKSVFYDLFTEEKLFDFPLDEETDYETDYYGYYKKGFDIDKIENAISYFDDKAIIEFGVCFYAETFFEKHIHDFRIRDGIDYEINMDDIIEYYYNIPFNSDEMMLITSEYAENYVTTVPLENQVTTEELGLTCTYNREEDRYFDFWKISNEEVRERASEYDLKNGEDKVSPESIYTLVIKDAEDNYKLMHTIMTDDGKTMSFYDFYTLIHLFDAPITSTFYYKVKSQENHYFEGIDLNSIKKAIPYFDDKKIEKVDFYIETNNFLSERLEELSKKDGIDYKCPEQSYYYQLIPPTEAETSMSTLFYSRTALLNNYLRTVPLDMQVGRKDLEVGLDKDKINYYDFVP